MNKKTVIVIVGPTAIGKSRLAAKLARKIKGEIISADSMQAYRGLDIISQKPTKKDRKGITHHLVDFLSPEKEYSAAKFAEKAEGIIERLILAGKVPIVAGGSGLYIKALIDGIFPSKAKDEKLRKELEGIAGEKGSAFLHEKLKKIDPQEASKIHPNDLRRIIRAIEIYELEKNTKTGLKKNTKGIKDKYDIRIFGLNANRKKLYEKIEKRVDLMFKKGVVREVKRLLKKKLSITSRNALGIPQIEGHLSNSYDLKKAGELLKRDTRRFAKRQITWFKADKRIVWLELDKIGEKQALEEMVRSAS